MNYIWFDSIAANVQFIELSVLIADLFGALLHRFWIQDWNWLHSIWALKSKWIRLSGSIPLRESLASASHLSYSLALSLANLSSHRWTNIFCRSSAALLIWAIEKTKKQTINRLAVIAIHFQGLWHKLFSADIYNVWKTLTESQMKPTIAE